MKDFLMRAVTFESKSHSISVTRTRTSKDHCDITVKIGGTQLVSFSNSKATGIGSFGDNYVDAVSELSRLLDAAAMNACELPKITSLSKLPKLDPHPKLPKLKD